MTDETTKDLMKAGVYYPLIRAAGAANGEHARLRTLVRIFREGKWYVLLIDKPMPSFSAEYEMLSLCTEAYEIQHLWELKGDEVEDILQISEEDRLRNLENKP